MSYEWDPAKAKANFAKHGVRFADAVTVLEDNLALTMRDPFSEEEERWITLGRDVLAGKRCTWPPPRRGLHLAGGSVRLISARPATARETTQYEEHHEA